MGFKVFNVLEQLLFLTRKLEYRNDPVTVLLVLIQAFHPLERGASASLAASRIVPVKKLYSVVPWVDPYIDTEVRLLPKTAGKGRALTIVVINLCEWPWLFAKTVDDVIDPIPDQPVEHSLDRLRSLEIFPVVLSHNVVKLFHNFFIHSVRCKFCD